MSGKIVPNLKRRRYDAAFRAEALRLAGESRSTQAAARALHIDPNRIYKWQKQALTPVAAARGAALDPATADELRQLRALAWMFTQERHKKDWLQQPVFFMTLLCNKGYLAADLSFSSSLINSILSRVDRLAPRFLARALPASASSRSTRRLIKILVGRGCSAMMQRYQT